MQTGRYMVAAKVNEVTKTWLKAWYEQTFLTPLAIRMLHLTLVPPFYFKTNTALPLPPEETISTGFSGTLACFEQQGRQILHIQLTPKIVLVEMAKRFNEQVAHLTQPDTAPYTKQVVPPFEPHITLNYHFEGNLSGLNLPDQLIYLEPAQLFMESEPKVWVEAAARKL